MSWRCMAVEWLAPTPNGPQVVTCDAHGEADSGAEKHTRESGHPTTSGTYVPKRSTP